jgi:hypothetical protein
MFMNVLATAKRFAPAAAVFGLVAVGTLVALPNNDDESDGKDLVPALVVTRPFEAGASSSAVESAVAIRMVSPATRPAGALASRTQIPDGVLAYAHVAGQQVLASSFAENVLSAVGDGFASVSVMVDPQRWVGPYLASGKTVDIYSIGVEGAEKIASKAVILGSPETEELLPKEETIVSLAVPDEALQAVLLAASENRLWMVGA